MNALPRTSLRAAALVLATLLSSCSLVGTPKKAPPVVAAPPVEAPAALPPLATHRFELGADRDDLVGVVQLTTTSAEDTFSDIARRFDLGYEEMVRANPRVDPWVPGAGRVVVVPTQFILPNAPRQGIVINIAAMRLYYFLPREPDGRQVVFTHPIGIGRVGWRTPEGVTRVVRKQKDPLWRPPPSIRKEHAEEGDPLPAVVAAGDDNPLGRSAMYLAWPSYLIHGTNRPYGVGLRSSHGCIRLYNEDVDRLFEKVPVGTSVRVVNQPLVYGWHEGVLYVQVVGVLEDDRRGDSSLAPQALQKPLQKDPRARDVALDWDAVGRILRDSRGIPIPVSGPSATAEEALAGARTVENRLPEGANWDGKVAIAVEPTEFQSMLLESAHAAAEAAPGATSSGAGGAPATPPAAAPSAVSVKKPTS